MVLVADIGMPMSVCVVVGEKIPRSEVGRALDVTKKSVNEGQNI